MDGVVSLIEQGNAEREARDQERVDRETYNANESISLVSRRFFGDFYEHLLIRNPDYNPREFTSKRRIWDPENPPPHLKDFVLASPELRADATFECEGIQFVCKWEYKGGWDLAWWDDGWWPQWFVVKRRRVGRDRLIRVYGPSGVAEALGG